MRTDDVSLLLSFIFSMHFLYYFILYFPCYFFITPTAFHKATEDTTGTEIVGSALARIATISDSVMRCECGRRAIQEITSIPGRQRNDFSHDSVTCPFDI